MKGSLPQVLFYLICINIINMFIVINRKLEQDKSRRYSDIQGWIDKVCWAERFSIPELIEFIAYQRLVNDYEHILFNINNSTNNN